MATTRNLAQLFRALAEKDVGEAKAIATQICKSEEKKGHRSAARILRGALHAGAINGSHPTGKPQIEPSNGITLTSAALVQLLDEVSLHDVVLAPAARRELESVILEWSKCESLQKWGLAPRSKLLFHGPPGCGKSLTARALAHELRIPIYVVRFDAVIGAYLGQTAIHLRQIFSFTETQPCVLLVDELDALGKRRGNPLDVGELDRIVIALMQELEHSRPKGIIIGTSNMAKNLDDALWRRFDLALMFKPPSPSVLTKFAKRLGSERHTTLPAALLRRAARMGSFAEAESLVIAEARRQVLQDS